MRLFIEKYHPKLIWHTIGAAWISQFLIFGGYSLLGHLVFGLGVLLASIFFLWGGAKSSLPKAICLFLLTPIVLGLLHILPLPGSLSLLLNPVKANLIQESLQLYGFLEPSSTLALNPRLAMLKLFHWICSAQAFTLLYSVKSSTKIVQFWFRLVAAWIFLMANLEMNGLIGEGHVLETYRTTLGGLANPNHFATTTILIISCLFGLQVKRLSQLFQHKVSSEKRLQAIGFAFLDVFLATVGVLAWVRTESRAALVLMLFSLTLIAALLCWPLIKKRKAFIPLLAGLFILLFIMAPVGKLLIHIKAEGVGLGGRGHAYALGNHFLSQKPYLGTGVKSSYTLLQSKMPANLQKFENWRDFHNEYIQIAVEWGLPGFIWMLGGLVLFGYFVWGFFQSQFDIKRIVTIAILGVLLAHAVFEFPLRTPAIKSLLIFWSAYALPSLIKQKSWSWNRWIAPVFTLLILLGLFLVQTWRKPVKLYPQDEEVQFAHHYGRISEVHLYQATLMFQDWMNGKSSFNDIEDQTQAIRSLIQSHFREDPFNLKALNLLFTVETLEARVLGTQTLEELEKKALILRDLGHSEDNIQSHVALFTLYRIFNEDLNLQQFQTFMSLKEKFKVP